MKLLTRIPKHFLRRGESGQAIIILAIGFIALLGFVGIVTDVSLMFVRYNTLRRAVDAASIAAAGQMRQDKSFATVSLAARQYIEFYGLDPVRVDVETCASVPDYNSDGNHDYLDDEQICTQDQRKLVRVTAQIESETVFLRLLGWKTLTLQAAAVSETAVIDVVLIFDVSESMLEDTTYEDWASIDLGTVFKPPTWQQIRDKKRTDGDFNPIPPAPAEVVQLWVGTGWDNTKSLLQVPQEEVNLRLDYPAAYNALELQPTKVDPDYPVQAWVPPSFTATYGTQGVPRVACTVRFFPGSQFFKVSPDTLQLYANNGTPWTGPANQWQGFRPTYDFYGCCNDPKVGATVDLDGVISGGTVDPARPHTGDFSFEDLICQPFKKARDATRNFLERIDFVRGDRVAFVTFSRSAYVLNPYDVTARDLGRSHMIDSFTEAVDTLNKFIGVRAEPNFYDWDEAYDSGTGGFSGWSSFAHGFDQNSGDSLAIQYESTTDPNAVNYNAYPARDDCPYQNAALNPAFSRYNDSLLKIMIPNINAAPWLGLGLDVRNGYELWASCRDGNVGAALREGNNALLDPRTSRRTGAVWVMVLLGDGAAGASDPVRRNGDVPISAKPFEQVSPGVFGVGGQYGSLGLCPYGTPSTRGELTETSDDVSLFTIPVFPYCSDEEPETRHFCNFRPEQFRDGEEWTTGRPINHGDGTFNNSLDLRTDNNYVSFPQTGWPAGWPDDPVVCPDALCTLYDLNGDGFIQSETAENLAAGNIYDVDIENTSGTNCDYYDVDDYARDWADFVSVAQPGQGDDAQLPTIFTIGFGLDFIDGSSGVPGTGSYVPGPPVRNPDAYLGEELLRYIADAGDNFKIDLNYQQDYLDPSFDHALDGIEPPEGWGARGVCEEDSTTPNLYDPLDQTENCGNYFNAPNQDELEIVFDEIASRMFTRLAG